MTPDHERPRRTERVIDTDALKHRPLPDHPASLYTVVEVAEAISPEAARSETALIDYRRRGWLAVHDVWDLQTVSATAQLLEASAAGHTPPAAARQLEASGLDNRAVDHPNSPRVRKVGFSVAHAAGSGLPVEQPTMLGIVRHLLGVLDIELHQAMALLKPPAGGREKPWHQDHAYFDLAIGTPVVGVWIAIDEARVDNGCMHLLDGGHASGPRPHFAIRDWQLCDTEMLGVGSVAVPLTPGGALFFDGLLPHGTPTNRSDRRRRAVQLHFCPSGAKRVTKAERFEAFGDRGQFAC